MEERLNCTRSSWSRVLFSFWWTRKNAVWAFLCRWKCLLFRLSILLLKDTDSLSESSFILSSLLLFLVSLFYIPYPGVRSFLPWSNTRTQKVNDEKDQNEQKEDSLKEKRFSVRGRNSKTCEGHRYSGRLDSCKRLYNWYSLQTHTQDILLRSPSFLKRLEISMKEQKTTSRSAWLNSRETFPFRVHEVCRIFAVNLFVFARKKRNIRNPR